MLTLPSWNNCPSNRLQIVFQAVFGLVLMSWAITASATVILQDSSPQTVVSEDFNFVFAGVPAPWVGGGIFTLTARGDYSTDGVGLNEEINWNIDGLVSGVADVSPLSPEVTILTTFGLDDISWEAIYSISAADMTAIVDDGTVNIGIDISDGVGVFNSAAFVDVALEYNSVPSPTTLALLGLGLAGFGFGRHKRIGRS